MFHKIGSTSDQSESWTSSAAVKTAQKPTQHLRQTGATFLLPMGLNGRTEEIVAIMGIRLLPSWWKELNTSARFRIASMAVIVWLAGLIRPLSLLSTWRRSDLLWMVVCLSLTASSPPILHYLAFTVFRSYISFTAPSDPSSPWTSPPRMSWSKFWTSGSN